MESNEDLLISSYCSNLTTSKARKLFVLFRTWSVNCLDLYKNNSEYSTAVSVVLIGLNFLFSITFFRGSDRSRLCMRLARTVSSFYALNIWMLARYWFIHPICAACGVIFYTVHEVIQFSAQLISAHCTSIFYSSRVRSSNIWTQRSCDSLLKSSFCETHDEMGCAPLWCLLQKLSAIAVIPSTFMSFQSLIMHCWPYFDMSYRSGMNF